MLIIPMWLEIPCRKKEKPVNSHTSFRYSPRTRIWWIHDWDTDSLYNVKNITTDITSMEDLLIAERQITQVYDRLELAYDDHTMHYTWCGLDGPTTFERWEEIVPDPAYPLPWNDTVDIPQQRSAYPFYYGDPNASCNMNIFCMSPDKFKIFGIIQYRNPERLTWRHVTGTPFKHTESGDVIYYIKVTSWNFHPGPKVLSQPLQSVFYRTPRNGEVLKDDMTKQERERTGLSLFLRPDPHSKPLY